MNKAIKQFIAMLLVVGMLGMCAPSMAEGSVSGLNGIVWAGEALESGKTLQSTETIIVDDVSLSPLLVILAGGSDEESIEQSNQLINAILAVIKNVSLRSTISMDPLAGKFELLLQDGVIASFDAAMQEDTLYLLTNLLPQTLFTLNTQELGGMLEQLQTMDMSTMDMSAMSNLELSQETMEAFQLAITEAMAAPDVVTEAEGTSEEDGVVYTSNVTINLPLSVLTELVADVLDIISNDEALSNYVYNLSTISKTAQNAGTITYEEFLAQLKTTAAEGHAEAASITEDFTAISVNVLSNEAEDTLVNVAVSNQSSVATLVKVAVTGGKLAVQVGVPTAYVTFTSTGAFDQANSNIDILLTITPDTDGIAMITDPAAVTETGEVVEIGFTLNSVTANETEETDYALTVNSTAMSVRIFGECNAVRSPLTIDSTMYIDLSNLLGLPEKAIGFRNVTREVDPISAPSFEGMNQINLMTIDEEQIYELGQMFTNVGLNTLITNLMTYLPEEAVPLMEMYLTLQQQQQQLPQ